ncbi:MAG: type I-E CRISPR-associated protein Cas7/Cse4/CasC [Methylohalobius crimeensis]
MFLQIHTLTSYHASLLNRDDAGLAKRIPFGGSTRMRVSSQCLKRHWTEWLRKQVNLPIGLRTRHFFSRELKKRLMRSGINEDRANKLILHLAKGLLTAAGEKDALDKKSLEMKQPVLFGKPEADYFFELLKEADAAGDEKDATTLIDERIKKSKNNFRALLLQAGIKDPMAGLEGALFGRFVTSDVLARVDAPVHVAHAFTTHALDTEVDFFTVVDDLAEDETGAAHAGDMELGTGIFYSYVTVDIPLLVSNLTGCKLEEWREQDHNDARTVLDRLIHAIAEVSPGAKLGATAPYACAEHLILESGQAQPRSLANAYLQPLRMREDRHPLAQSVEAMANFLNALEKMYGNTGENRYISSLYNWPRDKEPMLSLQQAIDRCLDDVFGRAP